MRKQCSPLLIYAAFAAIAATLVAVGLTSIPATAQSGLPAPASVRSVNGPSPGQVIVSWDPLDSASYYRIGWVAYEDYEAAKASGQPWLEAFTFVDLANRGQDSHTVNRLTPGILYAFIVASNDSRYGEPQWSQWALLTLNTDGSPCPIQEPTVTPTPTATLAPTPRPTATLAPTPTPRPTVPPAPTQTPAPAPELRHIEEKRYMLELINAERTKAGVGAVTLSDNIAAQLHAEAALENCFSSHWGIDGLKPYMRYSLAGGYQSNGENGIGLNYCIKASDGYRANDSIEREIEEAMNNWIGSSGHRRNILDPHHKKVSIGLAWNTYNTVMYQQFEGDYVQYDRLPSIANGVLSLSGKTRNGVLLRENRDLGIHIFYDPPPHKLTRGQVARTYCYDNGRRVASLRWPLTGGYRWTTDTYFESYQPCPSPYDVATTAPAPRSPAEAHQAWQQAYNASQSGLTAHFTVPWVTASEWTVSGTTFAVKADISNILNRHGAGVYSLMVWGSIGGERAVISQYSIFHDVTPPDTYDPAR